MLFRDFVSDDQKTINRLTDATLLLKLQNTSEVMIYCHKQLAGNAETSFKKLAPVNHCVRDGELSYS